MYSKADSSTPSVCYLEGWWHRGHRRQRKCILSCKTGQIWRCWVRPCPGSSLANTFCLGPGEIEKGQLLGEAEGCRTPWQFVLGSWTPQPQRDSPVRVDWLLSVQDRVGTLTQIREQLNMFTLETRGWHQEGAQWQPSTRLWKAHGWVNGGLAMFSRNLQTDPERPKWETTFH